MSKVLWIETGDDQVLPEGVISVYERIRERDQGILE